MVSSLYVRAFPPVGPPDPKTLYLPRLPKAKDVTVKFLRGSHIYLGLELST